MALKSFKDLLVWQKAQELSLDVYREFSDCRDYGFKDQLQRAAVSIANNIAEGYGRRSDKALINYLNIARGSTAEVESMIIMSYRLGYISVEVRDSLLQETDEVAKLVTGFIKKLSQDISSVATH